MARLRLGESGEVSMTPQRKDSNGKWKTPPRAQSATRWRARQRYCDWQGNVGQVNGFGRTRTEATANCEANLAAKMKPGTEYIRSETTIRAASGVWLDWISRPGGELSERTISDYTRTLNNAILLPDSTIASLSLLQGNDPQRLRNWLQVLADNRGTGTATRAKSILSGIMNMAVRNGVLTSNATKHVGRIRSANEPEKQRDLRRAFTRADRDAIVAYGYERAAEKSSHVRSVRFRHAAADFVAFLAGTGVRIGEGRLVLWSDLDWACSTVRVRGTKSAPADRTLTLPRWLIERLTVRHKEETANWGRLGVDALIFHAPAKDSTSPWDPSNNSSAVRQILDGFGATWAVPHTFRRTVATLLHESGIPIVRIADQLGHSDPAMTASVYLGRDFTGPKDDLAAVL